MASSNGTKTTPKTNSILAKHNNLVFHWKTSFGEGIIRYYRVTTIAVRNSTNMEKAERMSGENDNMKIDEGQTNFSIFIEF